jgi:steroid delta-isomerase-like uncharacterized protein
MVAHASPSTTGAPSTVEEIMTEQSNIHTTRRWFTEGWTDPSMAEEVFDPQFVTNGLLVGVEGPRTTVLRRLTGFPDVTTVIEDIVGVDETVVVRVLWRGTHTGEYGGVPATGRQVEVRVISMWRFRDGKVVDNWTIQDQFSLLQQVGLLPAELTTAQGRTVVKP